MIGVMADLKAGMMDDMDDGATSDAALLAQDSVCLDLPISHSNSVSH